MELKEIYTELKNQFDEKKELFTANKKRVKNSKNVDLDAAIKAEEEMINSYKEARAIALAMQELAPIVGIKDFDFSKVFDLELSLYK